MTIWHKSILFLGYDKNQTRIISELENAGCHVTHNSEKLNSLEGFDLVISFGYRYILGNEIIQGTNAPILNLHISYLPWNRGAHPNFWSFWDDTPTGVTIHLIDDGIDTGPILFQKRVVFDLKKETFESSYCKLKIEIENLFIENMPRILSSEYEAYPQETQGSSHRRSDLPNNFLGWNAIIEEEIRRLKKNGNSPV